MEKLLALRECIQKLPAVMKDEIEVKGEALKLVAELIKTARSIENEKAHTAIS